MADTDKTKDTESSSTATPEKKDTEPNDKPLPATSHIVDVTEEYLGQSFIITGAPKPKKHSL